MAEPLIRERYPEELENASMQVALRLVGLGIGRDDAERIGWEVAEFLRMVWGGRQSYIPSPDRGDARQLGLLESDGGTNQSEILADIAEQVDEQLVAIGTDHADASRMGWEVARHINAYWGGGLLYICKGDHYEISRRDQEIYRRYNGTNHDWLATEYDLTVQHIYRIVKRVGAAERDKRQARLFTESGFNPD